LNFAVVTTGTWESKDELVTGFKAVREALRENEAEVELATNEPPYDYTYFVHVERVGDFWEERQSHN